MASHRCATIDSMNQQVLPDEQIERELKQLNVAWSHIPGQGLVRVFQTSNFGDGLRLVNVIGKVAEQQAHHPDALLRYDEVELTLTTHDAGGITMADIELAKAIDDVT